MSISAAPIATAISIRMTSKTEALRTRANNAPMTVTHTSGTTSLAFDQTAGLASQWNYVGTTTMVAGAGNTIKISNAGTTSTVVAVALMFVLNPVPAGAMVGSVTTTTSAANLSPTGIVDWAHWGGTTTTPPRHGTMRP